MTFNSALHTMAVYLMALISAIASSTMMHEHIQSR